MLRLGKGPHKISLTMSRHILSLPKENNEFERKGSKKLDLTLPGVNENDVLNDLAKQLSAFANTGGGKIIYGVNK